MTTPLSPNVTPSFNFQNPGIGAVVQQGVAGLIHALATKKQLDQEDERLKQDQKEFELRQEQLKLNKDMSAEQIANMRQSRKENQIQFKQQLDLIQKQREGLSAYNRWVGGGQDPKDLGKIGATLTDPDVQEFFQHKVMENLQMQGAIKSLEKQPAPPSESWSPIGITPDGKSVIMNRRTGEQKITDVSLAGKGGLGTGPNKLTVGEMRGASLLLTAQQGMDEIRPLLAAGYTPLSENPVTRTARSVGGILLPERVAEGIARATSSPRGKLFQNAAVRVYASYLYAVSGAQIGDKEIVRQAEQQTADLFDSPTTFQQKMRFLEGSVAAIRVMAGRGAPGDETLVTPEMMQHALSVRAWAESGRQGPMPRPTMQMTPTGNQLLQSYQQQDPQSFSEFMKEREQQQSNGGTRF